MKLMPKLFSTEMVHRLQGVPGKTQTRRVINPQPDLLNILTELPIKSDGTDIKQKIHAGDIIWVRESWGPVVRLNSYTFEPTGSQYKYRADFNHILKGHDKFKSSIHMPYVACRMWLKVTEVRAQRVQGISEKDALAEGIQKFTQSGITKYGIDGWEWEDMLPTAKQAFLYLWDKLNGVPKPLYKKINGKAKIVGYVCYPSSKEAAAQYVFQKEFKGKPLSVIVNPYVWAITFEKTSKP